jgi:hypothetical protein
MFKQNIVLNAKLEMRGQGNKDADLKALMMYDEVERFRTESLSCGRLMSILDKLKVSGKAL